MDTLVGYMIEQFDLEFSDRQTHHFTDSIRHFAREFGCFTKKSNQISRLEFSTFWLKFTDLFRRIDSNVDGDVSFEEFFVFFDKEHEREDLTRVDKKIKLYILL